LEDSTLKCWGSNLKGALGLTQKEGQYVDFWIGNEVGEMGNGLPRIAVRRLSVTNTTPLGDPTENPFYISFTTDNSFSGLGSEDFTNSGSAKNCIFYPFSSSGSAATTVMVRVQCASSGSVQANLTSHSIQDSFGVTAPSSNFAFQSFNVPAPVQLITNTTSYSPGSQRFTLRLRFSESVTGISSQDFFNSATDFAATCTFIPSSSAAIADLEFILSVTCSNNGYLSLSLRENSVIATGNVLVPSTPQNLFFKFIYSNSPVEPVSLTAGRNHTCAILDNGTVKCWGNNGEGQLGNGTSTSTNTPGNPINLGTGRTATAIAAGLGHTCAILDNGTVTCWGDNSYGQLGNGTITDTNTPTNPINLGTGRTATAITTGDYHTCAILDNGTVTCWGENSAGQLGNGTTTDTNTPGNPINLGTGRTATAITTG
jgi:hypothetical protein